VPLEKEHEVALDAVKAFAEQARWAHAYHDNRSEVIGQRAATILAFDGALLSLLVAGLAAVNGNVAITGHVVFTVVLLAACLVLSAVCCLLSMAPRRVTIPDNRQLREQWARFVRPGSQLRPPAQIVHALLGGPQDPIASAAAEAKGRGQWYKRALVCLIGAHLALGALAVQLLLQQL
jgi:hypothetical protein